MSWVIGFCHPLQWGQLVGDPPEIGTVSVPVTIGVILSPLGLYS